MRFDMTAVGFVSGSRTEAEGDFWGDAVACVTLADGFADDVLQGLDAVLDIKRVMREFLPRGTVRQPSWASELMTNYWSKQ